MYTKQKKVINFLQMTFKANAKKELIINTLKNFIGKKLELLIQLIPAAK